MIKVRMTASAFNTHVKHMLANIKEQSSILTLILSAHTRMRRSKMLPRISEKA
jgi:hypothetical protein